MGQRFSKRTCTWSTPSRPSLCCRLNAPRRQHRARRQSNGHCERLTTYTQNPQHSQMICRCGRCSRPFRMSRHTSSALSLCRVQWPSEGRPSLRLPCIAGAGLCAVRLPAEPKSSWPSARVLPPAEDGAGRLPPRICAMKRSTLRAYGDSLGSSIFSVCPRHGGTGEDGDSRSGQLFEITTLPVSLLL